MTCRVEVDRAHMKCTDIADRTSDTCTNAKDETIRRCEQWADEGYEECDDWRDEGYEQCDHWADQGHNACAEKYEKKCKWYSPWNCVAGWFCRAWYWVANWVCKAAHWVANWVCKASHWVSNMVCRAWAWTVNIICQVGAWFTKVLCLFISWALKIVCAGFEILRCGLRWIFGKNRASKHPVKHVFVLMLENRSFDHMLGFSGIKGTDVTLNPKTNVPTGGATVTISQAGTNWYPDSGPGGVEYSMKLEAPYKISAPDIDPPHEFENAVINLCGAGVPFQEGQPYPTVNMSGFVQGYGAGNGDKKPNEPGNIMLGYSLKQLPILNRLAEEFVVCDQWFSSLPGPTFPNRFFMHAASSGGLDHSPGGADLVGNTLFDGYYFHNGTIFDRLDQKCMEWRIFAGDALPVSLSLSGMLLNELQGRIHDYDEFAEAVGEKDYSAAYTFIEPHYGNVLPVISPADFTCGNSQHPVDDVTRGERLIKDVYEAIRKSPIWEKSLLLVTYDEHGGFYDHVVPPRLPAPGDGIADEDWLEHGFGFDIAGVRVPAIIISPLIKKNGVDHTIYDHTSLLRTVEGIFDLKPMTRRDEAANSFLHLFELNAARQDAPTDIGQPAESGYSCESGEMLHTSSTSSALGSKPEWTKDDSPIPPTIRSFCEVAALKAIASTRGRDRAKIVREFVAMRTAAGAGYFMAKTANLTRSVRMSYQSSRSKFSHLFRSPLQKSWPADKLSLYRRPSPVAQVPRDGQSPPDNIQS